MRKKFVTVAALVVSGALVEHARTREITTLQGLLG